MTRQIASGFGNPPISLLEERIHELELKVALLTRAVEALTRAAEERRAHPTPEESPEQSLSDPPPG